MSQIRLYMDEDAAEHAVVAGLRTRGVDVLTVLEAGMAGASDAEQLAYAIAQDRTIYSLNVGDFAGFTRKASPPERTTVVSWLSHVSDTPLARRFDG